MRWASRSWEWEQSRRNRGWMEGRNSMRTSRRRKPPFPRLHPHAATVIALSDHPGTLRLPVDPMLPGAPRGLHYGRPHQFLPAPRCSTRRPTRPAPTLLHLVMRLELPLHLSKLPPPQSLSTSISLIPAFPFPLLRRLDFGKFRGGEEWRGRFWRGHPGPACWRSVRGAAFRRWEGIHVRSIFRRLASCQRRHRTVQTVALASSGG